MPRALDHLVIPAHDLAAQADFYRRLGFQVGSRNRHPWGTENHIVQFDGQFLELIGLGEGFSAPEDKEGEFSFAGFVAKYLEAREGLAMLVLRSFDAEADRREFAAKTIGDFSRFDFARKGRRPDGTTVDVAFSLAFAASQSWPKTGFFVCQQHFPENFWNAAAQVHPNGALGVSRLTFAHPQPNDGVAFLEAFCDAKAERQGQGFALSLENLNIEILPADGVLGMTSIEFLVRDLEVLTARLERENIAFQRSHGAVEIAASAAMGVELSFVA